MVFDSQLRKRASNRKSKTVKKDFTVDFLLNNFLIHPCKFILRAKKGGLKLPILPFNQMCYCKAYIFFNKLQNEETTFIVVTLTFKKLGSACQGQEGEGGSGKV